MVDGGATSTSADAAVQEFIDSFPNSFQAPAGVDSNEECLAAAAPADDSDGSPDDDGDDSGDADQDDGDDMGQDDSGDAGGDKVNICHAIAAEDNPYVFITVSTNSAAYQGHLMHAAEGNPAGGLPDLIGVSSEADCVVPSDDDAGQDDTGSDDDDAGQDDGDDNADDDDSGDASDDVEDDAGQDDTGDDAIEDDGDPDGEDDGSENDGVQIISIAADCSGSGTLTVNEGVNGATVTYHTPGSSDFLSTGTSETVSLVEGQATYPFTIDVTTGVPSEANTIRVEVQSTSGGTFTGETTKSASFGPCDATGDDTGDAGDGGDDDTADDSTDDGSDDGTSDDASDNGSDDGSSDDGSSDDGSDDGTSGDGSDDGTSDDGSDDGTSGDGSDEVGGGDKSAQGGTTQPALVTRQGNSGGTVTTLPEAGHGSTSATTDNTAIFLLFGALSLATMAAGITFRQRRTE